MTELPIPVVSTFAAAFAGAYGAQWLAESKRKFDSSLGEFRSTNSSIHISFQICNTLLSIKEQHTQKIKSQLDRCRAIASSQRNDPKVATGNSPINLEIEFHQFGMPAISTNRLSEILFNNISTNRGISIAFMQLELCVLELKRLFEERNAWITKHRDRPQRDDEFSATRYLGIPDRHGDIDQTYPMLVEAINDCNDSAIFFAKKLADLLVCHAKYLRSQYGDQFPKLQSISWAEAEEKNLLPDENGFEKWSKILCHTRT